MNTHSRCILCVTDYTHLRQYTCIIQRRRCISSFFPSTIWALWIQLSSLSLTYEFLILWAMLISLIIILKLCYFIQWHSSLWHSSLCKTHSLKILYIYIMYPNHITLQFPVMTFVPFHLFFSLLCCPFIIFIVFYSWSPIIAAISTLAWVHNLGYLPSNCTPKEVTLHPYQLSIRSTRALQW